MKRNTKVSTAVIRRLPRYYRQLLAAAIEKLSQREREIIVMRFGLNGGREQTQKEVADRLGISQSYISRLEKRIISRLKKEILKMS